MKSFILKDKSEVIYLNKKFYNKESIKECVKIYKDFIEFKFEESEKYVRIKIKSKDKDKYSNNLLAYEFLNYLLSLEYERSNSKNGL
jgi:dTDP-4-dehydrorhamnose 3,5-epimerase-like enzyme